MSYLDDSNNLLDLPGVCALPGAQTMELPKMSPMFQPRCRVMGACKHFLQGPDSKRFGILKPQASL